MRVSIALVLALATAACSGGATPSVTKVNRSHGTGSGSDDTTESKAEQPGETPGKPSANEPTPPQDPPESAPSSTPPPPAPPPPKTSTCTPPKCLAGGGLCGCKAIDGTGAHVDLGCQDGECACLSNGQVTSTFEGTCDTQDDATALFMANCLCN